MKSGRSRQSFHIAEQASRSSCHSDTVSCCPWRMPRPRILGALRTLATRFRSTRTVVGSLHNPSSSPKRGCQPFRLFGKHRQNRVEPYNGDDDTTPPPQSSLELRSMLPVTDLFAGLVAINPSKRRRGSPRKQVGKNPDPSEPSCSFSLPGAVDTKDKIIIAGARSSFQSTKCRYCSNQEAANEVMVDFDEEEEAEQVGVRLDTKHEENVDARVIHQPEDANSGDIVADSNNDDSQPHLTESEQNELTSSRDLRDEPENVIDSTHRYVVVIIIIITDIYNAPCLSHSDTPSADGPSSSFHLKDM